MLESVPCGGLAWHERRPFAQAQAERLSPFKNFGCNATVVRGRLLLWFWDQAEVQEALRQDGRMPAESNFLVEPLLRAPATRQGEASLSCWGGIDHQTWDQGTLVASRWEPTASASPTTALSSSPWSRELLNGTGLKLPWLDALKRAADGRFLVSALSLLVFAASCAYFAYWTGLYFGGTRHLAEVEVAADEADRAIGNLLSLRQSAERDERWVKDYTRLAASPELEHLFASLGRVMERQGVVMREFELRGEELRLAFSSAGGEIDLPELLRELSRMPGTTDVQLRDNVELNQVGFNLRIPGYMSVLRPSAAAPDAPQSPTAR